MADGIFQIRTPFTVPCPKCREMNAPYGSVTDPPISVQVEDHRRGIVRKWLAVRMWCSRCDHCYDMVIIDEVISDG